MIIIIYEKTGNGKLLLCKILGVVMVVADSPSDMNRHFEDDEKRIYPDIKIVWDTWSDA